MARGRYGKYRKYSDKFKAGALALVQASTRETTDAKVTEVAKHLKMPEKTLWYWVSEGVHAGDEIAEKDMAEEVEEAVQELDALFETELRAILKTMAGKREEAQYKELMIAAGIFADKIKALRDKPTPNTKQIIAFKREGISTVPNYIASYAIEGTGGEEEI